MFPYLMMASSAEQLRTRKARLRRRVRHEDFLHMLTIRRIIKKDKYIGYHETTNNKNPNPAFRAAK